jgi:RanBP-type and C3HC4-type zinc finger-containing protein 1
MYLFLFHRVNLFVEDKISKKGPLKINVSPLMTLLELKKKISKEFDIPIEVQQWKLNNLEAKDDTKTLMSYEIKDESGTLHLFIKEKVKQEKIKKEYKIDLNLQNCKQTFSSQETNILNISDSDDGSDSQNEKIGSEEGAVGISSTSKTENDWACPLCTLRNPSNRPGCLACSSMKPDSTKVTRPDKQKKPLESEKVPEQKNDLNKKTTNRKSSDVFNILVEETKSEKETQFRNLSPEKLTKNYQIPPQNSIVMTTFTSSPNITRNKYRGVDNFHPNSPYVWKVEPSKFIENPTEPKKHTPIVTKMILKTSPEKSSLNTNENHYQQLVNLDTADVVPNLEEFECPICMVYYKPREGIVLRDCLHVFCKECLSNTILFSEEAEIR